MDEVALTKAYYDVFNTESGQMVLMDLARRGHMFQPSWVRGEPDLSLVREGERNLFLYIMARANTTETEAMALLERINRKRLENVHPTGLTPAAGTE